MQLLKEFLRAFSIAVVAVCGVVIFAVFLDNEEKRKNKVNFDYKLQCDSLEFCNQVKDNIINGQNTELRRLEKQNDSIKKVLKAERIFVWKYYMPKKNAKKLLCSIQELQQELNDKDALLIELTNEINSNE